MFLSMNSLCDTTKQKTIAVSKAIIREQPDRPYNKNTHKTGQKTERLQEGCAGNVKVQEG